MIEKLLNISIVVKDQAAALEFYTNKVGFEKRTDFAPPGGTRWVTVAPKGQDLELSIFEATPSVDPKVPQSRLRPGGVHGTFKTTDCKRDFEDLSARGVKFNEPNPVEYPFGIIVSFTDPDGNSFNLLQPAGKR